MKRLFILFTSSVFALVVLLSCGSDDDDNTDIGRDTIAGDWEIKNRAVKTNYPDFDIRINPYFVADKDTLIITQSFDEASMQSKLTARRKGDVLPVRTYTYTYQIEKDSLLTLTDPSNPSSKLRGVFTISKSQLRIRYDVTKTELTPILLELAIDNNILSNYPGIEGDYNVTAIP